MTNRYFVRLTFTRTPDLPSKDDLSASLEDVVGVPPSSIGYDHLEVESPHD